MQHRRATDTAEFPGIEHERDSDTAQVARHILGMPLNALIAIGSLIVALFGVWLAQDRAIAAETLKQQQTEERVRKLEQKDEKRSDADGDLKAALTRIEGSVNALNDTVKDVKERVVRIEDHQQQGGGK